MRPEIAIAVISSIVSIGSVVLNTLATYRTTLIAHRLQTETRERTRAEQAEELFRRYREPLLWSAQSLQSRLFNGIDRSFLTRYLRSGNAEDERYVRDNTVYVLAEYLGWLELFRRDQRFLDVTAVKRTDELFRIIGHTHHALATETLRGPFRLFRGQQRAIGEVMLTRTETENGPQSEVLGYAAFCDRLDSDPSFARWFERLRKEVAVIESEGHSGNQRLIQLQGKLIELINLLDPDEKRLPSGEKFRLAEQRERRLGKLPVGRE